MGRDERTRCGLLCLMSAAMLFFVPSIYAEEPSTQIEWGATVICATDDDGKAIRIQCKDNGECLVAPDLIAGTDSPLRRAQSCSEYGGAERTAQLKSQGFTFTPAIAASPVGWARDDKGRVYQISFDLLRRVYIGAGWLPTFDVSNERNLISRSYLDFGIHASFYDSYEKSRHDLKVLDSNLRLPDLESRLLLIGYDYHVRRDLPLLWITTFFGTPKRYDLMMDMGWGFRLLNTLISPQGNNEIQGAAWKENDAVDIEWAEAHLGVDLWQSSDLYSHFRLELGGMAGTLWDDQMATGGSSYIAPDAALKMRFGLDAQGLHYLTSDLMWSMPYFVDGAFVDEITHKLSALLAYEWIPLAIVDQPISLRFGTGVDYREDLSSQTGIWEVNLLLGARFSLWAPARGDDLE